MKPRRCNDCQNWINGYRTFCPECRKTRGWRGYFYWGCLPDSNPVGPFETAEDALEDVRGRGAPKRSD